VALYNRLLLAATLLAFIVIGLGAYVRLSDAGLGCPDWPGCYGHWLGVPDAADEQLVAQQTFPKQPLNSAKAWKEMTHRYFAGTLGLLILGLCLQSWRKECRRALSPMLPTALLGIVGFQAALGMWTVTLLLKPMIVTLHLLGGMTTLALLVALHFRKGLPPAFYGNRRLQVAAALALFVLVGQITLGGWVSSNYAALACMDFPRCQGHWQPLMDFGQGFSIHRDLGNNSDGKPLPLAALTAIHWSHRLGAVTTVIAVGVLAIGLIRTGQRNLQGWSILLLGMMTIQAGLGVANVLFWLPLPLAVAHNLGAACLLSITMAINIQLHQMAKNPIR
jgi:heme a synthase